MSWSARSAADALVSTEAAGARTVALALLANAGVGLGKLVAGLVSGSGVLLLEAAHSAGDTSTELLLATALWRSSRPADQVRPARRC